MAVTPKQKAVYDYIKQYVNENGFSPTFDEIALNFNYRSKGTVYKHIKALRLNGMIHQEWNRTRSMKISKSGKPNKAYLPVRGSWGKESIDWAPPPHELINVPANTARNNRSYIIRVKNKSLIDHHMLPGDMLIVQPATFSDGGRGLIYENKTGGHIIINRARKANPDQIIGKITGLVRSY